MTLFSTEWECTNPRCWMERLPGAQQKELATGKKGKPMSEHDCLINCPTCNWPMSGRYPNGERVCSNVGCLNQAARQIELATGKKEPTGFNLPAFPLQHISRGLTKREWMAGMVAAGAMSQTLWSSTPEAAVKIVEFTDVLLAELEKSKAVHQIEQKVHEFEQKLEELHANPQDSRRCAATHVKESKDEKENQEG
jgi:hypothetical protein